jgi:hypothetical protein
MLLMGKDKKCHWSVSWGEILQRRYKIENLPAAN